VNGEVGMVISHALIAYTFQFIAVLILELNKEEFYDK
jgi:hypothetical protein